MLMSACVDAVRAQGAAIDRVSLVGGGVKWTSAKELSSAVLGVPVDVPSPGEYVANGAAKQAAWVLAEARSPPPGSRAVEHLAAEPLPEVRAAYDRVSEIVAAAVRARPAASAR